MQTLGYSLNNTISSNNSRMKRTSKLANTENNEEKKNEDQFFLTQGNNPNEVNTIWVTKTHNEKDENDKVGNNVGDENENHEENKEYMNELEN